MLGSGVPSLAAIRSSLCRCSSLMPGATGTGTAADWASVFGWLRASCQDGGDKPGELYYALAVGTVEYVSRWFVHSLEHSDPAEWVRVLRRVTTAPNRLDHRQPPSSQLRGFQRLTPPSRVPIQTSPEWSS